jgi:hypothetical protein
MRIGLPLFDIIEQAVIAAEKPKPE